MDYNQYIKLVKQRAAISTDQQVVTAVHSVLEVLAERLTPDKADNLAALLPKELKPYIKTSEEAEQFDLEEFLAKVGKKEGTDPTIAFYHARAALSVLAAAVPPKELSQALSELPEAVRDLFMVEHPVKKEAA